MNEQELRKLLGPQCRCPGTIAQYYGRIAPACEARSHAVLPTHVPADYPTSYEDRMIDAGRGHLL